MENPPTAQADVLRHRLYLLTEKRTLRLRWETRSGMKATRFIIESKLLYHFILQPTPLEFHISHFYFIADRLWIQ